MKRDPNRSLFYFRNKTTIKCISLNKQKSINLARKKNYLNNKDFYAEMVLSKDADVLTKTAEKMLILLAEKTINKMRYVSDDDRNDCLQFAMLDLLKYWRNFNPKYPNAFAYFTEIAKRGYAKGWNKIHPQKYKGTISIGGNSDGEGSGIYTI